MEYDQQPSIDPESIDIALEIYINAETIEIEKYNELAQATARRLEAARIIADLYNLWGRQEFMQALKQSNFPRPAIVTRISKILDFDATTLSKYLEKDKD